MTYVRIKAYHEGQYVGEHLYIKTGTQQDAIDRLRKDIPEWNNCILVATDYDSEDPNNAEHFRVCKDCGCVHFFN